MKTLYTVCISTLVLACAMPPSFCSSIGPAVHTAGASSLPLIDLHLPVSVVTSVPEPSAFLALFCGVSGLVAHVWRRHTRA